MTIRQRHSAFPPLALSSLLCLLLALSCSVTPIGIYTSISEEKPIGVQSTASLSAASPSAVVRFNDKFYMTTGFIYTRPLALSKNAWTPIASASLPSATVNGAALSAQRCLQIASDGARLYAAWLSSDYASMGLYASQDAASWTPIDSAAGNLVTGLDSLSLPVKREITKLFCLNGVIFASVKESTSADSDADGEFEVYYKLYYVSGDAAVSTGLSLNCVEASPYSVGSFRSGTYDGSRYWFISGSGIYSGTIDVAAGTASFAALAETGMPVKQRLKSISWSAELGRLIVTTGSGSFETSDTVATLVTTTPGVVYARLPDGSWEASAASTLVSAANGGYANFTDALVVPGSSGAPVVVCAAESSLKYDTGTERYNKKAIARGYGVLIPSSGSIAGLPVASTTASQPEITTWSNYETTLMNTSVQYLYYLDGENSSKVLFACTSGDGLWSNVLGSSGAWGTWNKE
jgi:hypothetical protein